MPRAPPVTMAILPARGPEVLEVEFDIEQAKELEKSGREFSLLCGSSFVDRGVKYWTN